MAKEANLGDVLKYKFDKKDLVVSDRGGLKYSKNKLRWTKFPFDAAEWIMKVMHHGAEKYSWDNWRLNPQEDYMDALERHWISHTNGERIDKDSGLPTIALVATNALFCVWKELCEGKE